MLFFLRTSTLSIQFLVSCRFACFSLTTPISVLLPLDSALGFGTFGCLIYTFGTMPHGQQALGSQGPKRQDVCGPKILWLRRQ